MFYKCPICKKKFPNSAESRQCYQKCQAVLPPLVKTISAGELGAVNADINATSFTIEFISDNDWGLHETNQGQSAIIRPIADVFSELEARSLCFEEVAPGISLQVYEISAEPFNPLLEKVDQKMVEYFQKVTVSIDPAIKFELRESLNKYNYSISKVVMLNGWDCWPVRVENRVGYVLK